MKFLLKQDLRKESSKAVLSFDAKLDSYFELDIQNIESDCMDDRIASYMGIDPSALLTSYLDYYQILDLIPKGEYLIDLGAGHCRGTLLSFLLKKYNCISYEFVESRTVRAQAYIAKNKPEKLEHSKDFIHCSDLDEVCLPMAYGYYLYFPRGKVLDNILKQLLARAGTTKVNLYVTESHGDVLDYIDALGFRRIEKMKASLPRHHDYIIHYQGHLREIKNINNLTYEQNLALWLLYNKDKYLVIKYYDIKKSEYIDWIVPVNSIEWIMYLGKPSLEMKSGRIILISQTEKIINSGLLNDLHLDESYYSTKRKILRRNGQIFLED